MSTKKDQGKHQNSVLSSCARMILLYDIITNTQWFHRSALIICMPHEAQLMQQQCCAVTAAHAHDATSKCVRTQCHEQARAHTMPPPMWCGACYTTQQSTPASKFKFSYDMRGHDAISKCVRTQCHKQAHAHTMPPPMWCGAWYHTTTHPSISI